MTLCTFTTFAFLLISDFLFFFFVFFFLLFSLIFSLFLYQGNDERQLMDNLKKRERNIVAGIRRTQQIMHDRSDIKKETAAPPAPAPAPAPTLPNVNVTTTTARNFLMNVSSAINRILAELCKKKRVAFRSSREEFETSLNDATRMEPAAAMQVFKVQITKMMKLADDNDLIPWKMTLEKTKWLDALDCSTTFAQMVFYVHRLRYYQKRPKSAFGVIKD